MSNSIIVNPVRLIPLPENTNGELSDVIYRVCNFCCKNKEILSSNKMNERMSSSYHCSFCLRHEFHTKLKSHVLIMSFCNVFGYYYHEYHLKQRIMWLSEIADSSKKLTLDEVLKTVFDVLNCFQNIAGLNMQFFYAKYKEAIVSFYSKRHRPKHKRILSPTFINCLNEQKPAEFYEKTRNFNLEEILKTPLT